MPQDIRSDPDAGKGAVESSKPGSDNDVSMTGQLPHRNSGQLGGADSDFPEPGAREEHSGERQGAPPRQGEGRKPSASTETEKAKYPEGVTQAQEPGHSQKTNQNQQKEDPLAS